jgi:hypothetical protein
MKVMRRKLYTIVILFFISSFILLCGGFSNAGSPDAGQCSIVRIGKETIGGESRIYLYPSELKIAKNGCVIWINWTERENVSISFHENSKSCMVATKASSGFLEVEGCFLSDFLAYGQTVSLYFKETGTFGYRLEILEKTTESGGKEHRKVVREGKIIVE